MCGRFNLTATPEQVIETFKLQSLFDFQASYNITPGQEIVAIVPSAESNGGNEFTQAVSLRWGWFRPGQKDRKISSQLINARARNRFGKAVFPVCFSETPLPGSNLRVFLAADRIGQTGLSHHPFRPTPFCFCPDYGTLGAGW